MPCLIHLFTSLSRRCGFSAFFTRVSNILSLFISSPSFFFLKGACFLPPLYYLTPSSFDNLTTNVRWSELCVGDSTHLHWQNSGDPRCEP